MNTGDCFTKSDVCSDLICCTNDIDGFATERLPSDHLAAAAAAAAAAAYKGNYPYESFFFLSTIGNHENKINTIRDRF